MVDTFTRATRFTPLTADLGQRLLAPSVFPDTCTASSQTIDAIEGSGYLARQRLNVHSPSLRNHVCRMPNQRWLIARTSKRLRGHIRRIGFDEQLAHRRQSHRLPQLLIALKRNVASKGEHIATLNRLPRHVKG